MNGKSYKSLQDWMERTGTNQTELARRAGMTKAHLSMVLKGSRRCSLTKALTLSAITGVPVEKLTEWPKVSLKRTFLSVA
jgi:transcriptional regulator with XRE-family HTH domain